MDYEKAYTNAVARAKQAIKDCGDNEGRKRMIEGIFPELAENEDELMRKEAISIIRQYNIICEREGDKCYTADRVIAWLEKQGKRNPDWNEYDKAVIYAIYNTLSHCNVTKCGCLEVTDMLEWLEELEKQGKRDNIVEQLTAFAQHLNKRGAFREDLCMDFEHEAQSFIEFQKYIAKQKEL